VNRSGYFDGGQGRAGWEATDRCPLNSACALVAEHGGGCDPRPEPERAAALLALLDAGVLDVELERRMAEGARDAFGRLPS
jgi:hypothetical protein